MISEILEIITFFIRCPFKLFFGISCPGCGMTRAWISAMQLDFERAFYYHPLFWIALVAVLIVAFQKKINTKIYNIAMICSIILLLAVYICRMFDPCCDIVVFDPQSGLICKIISFLRG